MREYLENTLRQSVSIKENNSLSEKLPLAFKGRYIIYDVETNGFRWIAIKTKTEAGLIALRKDLNLVQKVSGLNCALFLTTATVYIKDKLIEEGIPFVVLGKLVYLPFIGYLLSDSGKREISPVHLISFLTQKLVLTAIYEKWTQITVSEAAVRLGVSKMSVSRCFDEIEYLNIDILSMKGKSRVVTVPEDIKQLWNKIRSILRNPVIKSYELREDIHLKKKAGISALCEYSLLSDNHYPTYAVTKAELTESGIKNMPQTRKGEETGCVVYELGYFLDIKKENTEDPLSVTLSLTEKVKQEERVIISENEMLEGYVW